jgi:hypothetical protein
MTMTTAKASGQRIERKTQSGASAAATLTNKSALPDVTRSFKLFVDPVPVAKT